MRKILVTALLLTASAANAQYMGPPPMGPRMQPLSPESYTENWNGCWNCQFRATPQERAAGISPYQGVYVPPRIAPYCYQGPYC